MGRCCSALGGSYLAAAAAAVSRSAATPSSTSDCWWAVAFAPDPLSTRYTASRCRWASSGYLGRGPATLRGYWWSWAAATSRASDLLPTARFSASAGHLGSAANASGVLGWWDGTGREAAAAS